ncbi:MAG: TonB-dependent receptor, partial [Acidobacteria bacterium]|nr:TonB-dependent receptor [Acidobacteriota bacterium]
MIELAPGTVLTKTNSTGQGQFSVNGQRANANYFMVDGVSANAGVSAGFSLDQTAGGTIPTFHVRGGLNNLVSVDALQEFRIQASTYAAEFGRMPGGQVSILTRSGTNQFHGALFDYLRNDALDANDWFANSRGLPKPALRQNDFGGVIGGPIIKNRTFFFFSYEGLRLRQPQVGITVAPTLSARRAAPAQLKPYLDAFPIPNGRDLGDGFAESSASYSNPSTLNATSIRVDHTLSSRLTLFGRFNYAPSENIQRLVTQSLLNNLETTQFKTETLTFGSTQALTQRISNDLRVNYSRNSATVFYWLDNFAGGVPPPDSALFTPFASRGESIFVFLVGPVNYLVGGDDLTNFQRQINVIDNLLLATGRHQLKFGIDYRRLAPSLATSKATVNALYNDMAAVISNSPFFVGIAARTDRFPSYTNFSAYGQDSWKVTRGLTINYGLRWELNPPPSDRRGNDPFTVTGVNDPATMTLAPLGTPLWATTYHNFAPRVGLAYQIFQAAGREMVLRGGFGLFY